MDEKAKNDVRLKSIIGIIISCVFVLIYILWLIYSLIWNRDLIANIIYFFVGIFSLGSLAIFTFQYIDYTKSKEDEPNIV